MRKRVGAKAGDLSTRLAKLYRDAAELGQTAGQPALTKVMNGAARDDAYWGALLATNALSFHRIGKA